MTRQTHSYRIGNVEVTRIDELTLKAFPLGALYPAADPAVLDRHRPRFSSGSFDAENGIFIQSVHSWLVRTPRHTILIDTATGNGKSRPTAPPLDHLDEPYLEQLAAAGVQPQDVDYVLLTHVHADHVGWNTRLIDGRWAPTFPRARYVMSAIEQSYNQGLARGEDPARDGRLGPRAGTPMEGVYDDSVRPVIEDGLADFIKVDGSEFLDGFSFLPSPGHSIDHASIRLVSQGEEALFAGDVMHHPLQIHETDLNSCFCEFPEAAARSRLWALNHAAERNALFFTTHFAETSAGRVTRSGERFDWRFV